MSAPADAPPRHRDWGESVALVVGYALYLIFPNRYTVGGPIFNAALTAVFVVVLALSVFWTIAGSRKYTRIVMMSAAALFGIVVIASAMKVVFLVVYHSEAIEATRLLETAATIWIFNIIIFAIAYHWIGEKEFVFPRDADSPKPLVFLDYVFLSFSTATAFSATDTPPLTTRARMCMMIEASISLATIAIAAARAVNILS